MQKLRLDGIQHPITQLLPHRFQCNLEHRVCKSFWHHNIKANCLFKWQNQTKKNIEERLTFKVECWPSFLNHPYQVHAKQKNWLSIVWSPFKGKFFLKFTNISFQIRLVQAISGTANISRSEKGSKTAWIWVVKSGNGSHSEFVPCMPFKIQVRKQQYNRNSQFKRLFDFNQQFTQKLKLWDFNDSHLSCFWTSKFEHCLRSLRPDDPLVLSQTIHL